jgi:hypothetical protein
MSAILAPLRGKTGKPSTGLTVEDPITPENKRTVALDRAFRTLHAPAPDEYCLLLCRTPLELIGLEELSGLFLGLSKLAAMGRVVRETTLWQLAVRQLDDVISSTEGALA